LRACGFVGAAVIASLALPIMADRWGQATDKGALDFRSNFGPDSMAWAVDAARRGG